MSESKVSRPREPYVDRPQLVALLAAVKDLGDDDTGVALAGLRFGAIAARRTRDPAWLPKVAQARRAAADWDDAMFTAHVVLEAITALVKRRAGLDPAILALAHDPRGQIRAAVADGLPNFEPACRELLLKMLHDRHARVRARARKRLGAWAEAVPWWTGLTLADPEAALTPTELEQLRAANARMGIYGQLAQEDRAALATLPQPVLLDVLEGLLVAAGARAVGEHTLLGAVLEAPGGLDLLCRVWGTQPPEALAEWASYTAGAVSAVAPRRRARIALRLARRALTLPRGPRSEVPADEAADLPSVFASWAEHGWPAEARPSRLLTLLTKVPVAASHERVRERLVRTLARTGPAHAGALGERALRALAQRDEALLAQLGGEDWVKRLAELAPPALRRPLALEALDAPDAEARERALRALVLGRLSVDEDVPRLQAALARHVHELPPDVEPSRIYTPHLIPHLRAQLRAGQLSEHSAASLLQAIGARAGGVWAARPEEPPERPLDVGGPLGEPIAPPTAEEWAGYRTARATFWAEEPDAIVRAWSLWGVLPERDWAEDDWHALDVALHTLEAGTQEDAVYTAERLTAALRLEGSPRAAAMLKRVRALGIGR